MIRCWDYFMRRKAHLLPIMILFLLSSLLSYSFLHQQQIKLPTRETPTTYINVPLSDLKDSSDDVEVPHTGGLITSPVATPTSTASPAPLVPTALAAVISPQEVTDLEIYDNNAEQNLDQETAEPVVDVLAPDALPQYTWPAPAPTTTSADSRTLFIVMLLIGCSITGGFWLYFLYEHYTR